MTALPSDSLTISAAAPSNASTRAELSLNCIPVNGGFTLTVTSSPVDPCPAQPAASLTVRSPTCPAAAFTVTRYRVLVNFSIPPMLRPEPSSIFDASIAVGADEKATLNFPLPPAVSPATAVDPIGVIEARSGAAATVIPDPAGAATVVGNTSTFTIATPGAITPSVIDEALAANAAPEKPAARVDMAPPL